MTNSISNKNLSSGNANTILLEKIEPAKTQNPIRMPCMIAIMFKKPSWWNAMPLVNKSDRVLAYVAYLADLAVDHEYQRSGIGKQLIEETKSRLGPECMIVLLAAPKANEYYEHIGFEHNPRAWTLKNN